MIDFLCQSRTSKCAHNSSPFYIESVHILTYSLHEEKEDIFFKLFVHGLSLYVLIILHSMHKTTSYQSAGAKRF